MSGDEDGFSLDSRLATDSHRVTDLGLSQVRLIDDARYDWLVLVPRVAGAVEWIDLAPAQQHALIDEVARVGMALRAASRCEKLNIGALGNSVRQLHVHVLARNTGDPAWPGPVWGASPLQRRGDPAREAAITVWRDALAATRST